VEKNLSLLKKVREDPNPSGLLGIWENLRGPERITNAAFDFFSLTYLLLTGGQTYGVQELSNWLDETGFGKIHRYRTVPGLLTATRM